MQVFQARRQEGSKAFLEWYAADSHHLFEVLEGALESTDERVQRRAAGLLVWICTELAQAVDRDDALSVHVHRLQDEYTRSAESDVLPSTSISPLSSR